MSLQNRVMPTGDIIADPARGRLTGNRGILHGPDHVLGRARWQHKAWICCTLEWKNVRRTVMTGRSWTELFFLDEATALAAGHRPCALCRRDAFNRFCAAWATAFGNSLHAPKMDRILHAARVNPDRSQRRFSARLDNMPSGTFILVADQPQLLWQDRIWPYAPAGYGLPCTPPATATILTPAPIIALLLAGYLPDCDPASAQSASQPMSRPNLSFPAILDGLAGTS